MGACLPMRGWGEVSGPEGTPNGVDRLARIEEWVGNGNFAPRDDVLALVEIAKQARAVTDHHFDTCDLVLGLSPAYPCSCGIDALRSALARLDSGAAEEDA